MVLFPLWVNAQTHVEYWSKFQIEKTVRERLILGSDIQFRTQSNYVISNTNPFQYPLSYSVRIWGNVKFRQLTVITAPIAYFRHFDINKDTLQYFNEEIRTAAGLGRTHTLKKHDFNFRLLYEHRYFMRSDLHNDRLRFLIKWRPNVFSTRKLNVQPYIQEEYFLRLNTGEYLCDQNRIQTGIRYKTKNLDISIAYQYTTQKQTALTNSHQIFTGILYNL